MVVFLENLVNELLQEVMGSSCSCLMLRMSTVAPAREAADEDAPLRDSGGVPATSSSAKPLKKPEPKVDLANEGRAGPEELLSLLVEASRLSFESFPSSLKARALPIVVFSPDVSEQRVWHTGSVSAGKVLRPEGEPDIISVNPVVMSPAYLGFSIEPSQKRYLHYRGVGIIFSRPTGGTFMQPSIDTILVCGALYALFSEGAVSDWTLASIADGGQKVGKSASSKSNRTRTGHSRSPRTRPRKGKSLNADGEDALQRSLGGWGPRRKFYRAVDIGSGSGFLGKFVAAYAAGDGDLEITLVDVDPKAMDYVKTNSFNAPSQGMRSRKVRWKLFAQDAVELLDKDSDFDLIVSNPPYVPTLEETQSSTVSHDVSGFWEGVGLVVYLINLLAEGRCRDGAHLILMVTSLTLKSVAVREALEAASARGLLVNLLVEREIAWKAWYAGPGSGIDQLLATGAEVGNRQRIGANSYYVGAVPPSKSRTGLNGRDKLFGYHWHMAYVLCIHRPEPADERQGPVPSPEACSGPVEVSCD